MQTVLLSGSQILVVTAADVWNRPGFRLTFPKVAKETDKNYYILYILDK